MASATPSSPTTRPSRYFHAAIDHDIREPRGAANIDIRQNDCILDRAIGIDPHAGKQNRTPQLRAGNDAAAGNKGGHRHARGGHPRHAQISPAGSPRRPSKSASPGRTGQDPARRRSNRYWPPNRHRPCPRRANRLCVSFDERTQEVRKPVRDRFAVFHKIGNDVLAEIPARIWRRGIAGELVEKKLRLEDINAHRGETIVRVAGHAWRIFWLFDESR